MSVVERSFEEARLAGSETVRGEHFLLALTSSKNETIQKCLRHFVITREAILQHLPPFNSLSNVKNVVAGKTFHDFLAMAKKQSNKGDVIGPVEILHALLLERNEPFPQLFSKLKAPVCKIQAFLIDEIRAKLDTPTKNELLAIMNRIHDDSKDSLNNLDFLEGKNKIDDIVSLEEAPVSAGNGNDYVSSQGEFGRDLTALAREGKIDPVIGRTEEINRVLQILCRRTKNNVLLLGEAGVGKTAIVEGIAMAIADGTVPFMLRDKRIISLDLTSIVAGTQYRGQFEERMKALLDDLEHDDRTIVFIDELHTIVSAGAAENGLDISNIIKPALSRGALHCIGATTMKEYHATIEKDSALDRRFQTIVIKAPGKEATLKILKGIAPAYEKHHNVKYGDDILRACIELSERYLPKRQMPDKVIDIIDEIGSNLNLRNAKKTRPTRVAIDDVYAVVSAMSGFPIKQLKKSESEKLLQLDDAIAEVVIGQEEAIHTVCRALRRSRAELKDSRRPIGSFLFLGPSGVGKTLLAETLAEKVFTGEESLVRLDMSEYAEEVSVSRLIGSTPGYIGYNDGGQLTERIKHNPYSVVLFDEIDRANPGVTDLLLQILEKGTLTDGSGTQVSFRNCIIILTSNIGFHKADIAQKSLGFSSLNQPEVMQKDLVIAAAKMLLRTELLNRLDDIVIFRPLEENELRKIVELEVERVRQRLRERGSDLQVEPALLDLIRKQAGGEEYGARFYRRQVERLIEDPLADELLKVNPNRPFTAVGKLANNKIMFEVIEQGEEK